MGPRPYFHPYNSAIRGGIGGARRTRTLTAEHIPVLGGRSDQTTQIYEGTNQIQRMVIARKVLG